MTKVGISKKLASMKAGTVVILLTGPHAGRRAVVLKVLEKGRIAVTGPQSVNSVPLTRIPVTQVIKTSTAIDLAKLDTSKVTDELFQRGACKKLNKYRKNAYKGDIINKQQKKLADKEEIPHEVVELQKTIDDAVLAQVKKTSLLDEYLKQPFSLDSTFGLYPHELTF